MTRNACSGEEPMMFDLAHVTDLHLVEREHAKRTGSCRHRLRFLSAGRRLDAEGRRAKALTALRDATRHARHVVVTGDLTEDGIPAQFELLAEVLGEIRVDPRRVTLVPGNHDRYAAGSNFADALRGPLRAFAASSAAGRAIELGRHARLLPVSTAIAQSWVRSVGRLSDDDVERIDGFAADARRAGKLAVVAQHHPPHGYGGAAWNFIDGLLNAAVGRALMCAHVGLQFLHGHTHKHESAVFAAGRPAQAHSAGAVVARAGHVRYYQVDSEGLIAVDAGPLPELGAGPAVALA